MARHKCSVHKLSLITCGFVRLRQALTYSVLETNMYSRESSQYVLETPKYMTHQGNDTSPPDVKHIFPDQKSGPDTAGSSITAVFEARENRWEK